MIKSQEFITNSFEETQKVGENLILQNRIPQFPPKGSVTIALYGDLGSGKTTFVQGLARGLGIDRRIISPTFIIMRTYKIKFKIQNSKFKIAVQNAKLFYHVDLYRTESINDIKGLGIEEIMKNPDNFVVIEWAEKMGSLLPEHRADIKFEYISENERRVVINSKY